MTAKAASSTAAASEATTLPVQEIARRAGVGTGTVSRHFPTKESLFEAVVLVRASGLAEQAARLARSGDPGAAFFEYFALLITEGAANLGMAEALMGAGYDLDAACLRDGIDLKGALDGLLVRAQRAGAVRADVNGDDVKALMTSCLSRTPTQADPAARDRMIAIATQGLRNPLQAAWPGGPASRRKTTPSHSSRIGAPHARKETISPNFSEYPTTDHQ
jgi:AcrR family transcriptional regulator